MMVDRQNIEFIPLTPRNKSCKSLGLRRSIQKSAKTKISPNQEVLTPQSIEMPGMKVTPKVQSPFTPKTAVCTAKISTSICSARHKLSLSDKLCEKYKKRRLEFVQFSSPGEDNVKNDENYPSQTINNIAAQTTEEVALSVQLRCSNNESILVETLKENADKLIMAKSEYVSGHQEHEIKIKELKESIIIWKDAFTKATKDLCAKFTPPITEEQLLQNLHIPASLLKHIEAMNSSS